MALGCSSAPAEPEPVGSALAAIQACWGLKSGSQSAPSGSSRRAVELEAGHRAARSCCESVAGRERTWVERTWAGCNPCRASYVGAHHRGWQCSVHAEVAGGTLVESGEQPLATSVLDQGVQHAVVECGLVAVRAVSIARWDDAPHHRRSH